ncbi:hypothetical protein FOA52_015008 [Chlamydomonas sp. UWO 241]|nr:hypothetical protein FOA52_015008 [Chlamydomonas sp. UWO 241]
MPLLNARKEPIWRLWRIAAAAAAVLPLSLLISLPAAAEEAARPLGMIVDEVARTKIMENAVQEIGGTGASAQEIAVTALFYVVVALLTVVTAGMVYLGVAQALDKKQETQFDK